MTRMEGGTQALRRTMNARLRILTGVVARVVDVPAVGMSELVARISGFGPSQPFLDVLTVDEIWINDLHKFAGIAHLSPFVPPALRRALTMRRKQIEPRTGAA